MRWVILFGVEAEAVHSCVEFDMNREVRNAFMFSSIDECVEQSETINLRLEVVLEERAKATHLRVHDHDALGDALLAKCHAFVGNSDCQIINQFTI